MRRRKIPPRGEPSPDYALDRTRPAPPSGLRIGGFWTPLRGVRVVYAPAPNPPFRAASRKERICLVWEDRAPENAEDAARWGWWPLGAEAPPVSPPHFAVDNRGVVVQFLDCGNYGSSYGHEHSARASIVIANLTPRVGPRHTSEAQRQRAKNLISLLQTIYRTLPVCEDEQWQTR